MMQRHLLLLMCQLPTQAQLLLHRKRMEKRIEKINKFVFQIKTYLILAILFLFPLTYLPFFIDVYNPAKLIVLWTLICLTLIAIGVETYITKRLQYARGKFDFAVLGIVVSYLVFALIVSPNKMEAFFLPGTASFVIGAAIVYFFLNTITDKSKIKMALIASVSVLSLALIFNFNTAGDYITGIIFIVIAAFFAIFLMLKESKRSKKIILGALLFIMLIGVTVSLLTLFDSSKKVMPLLPPFGTSWSVSVDTIRESPIFGIGPGNYLTAFNRFRPITYNQTNLWQVRFSTGRNWYLTVITETGLLGLAALVLLLVTLYKNQSKKKFVLI